jgi:hypothetical protein
MPGLFPIIRRKRRPFIEPEVPPVAVPQAAPVQPVAATKLTEAVLAKPAKTKSSDAKNPASTAAP